MLFVVSRLDYYSTLCHGLPAFRIGSLNRVLRTAARLVDAFPCLAKSLSTYGMNYTGSLTLAPQPGTGFLSLFGKCMLITPSHSSLPTRPLCLTEAGLGSASE